MSAPSPSRSFRAKTSDFIRSVGQSTYARQSHTDLTATSSGTNLAVPSTSGDEGFSKKKITRIPLFTRPRKKSNQSATFSPYSSVDASRHSTEGGELSDTRRAPSTDSRRPSEPIISVQPPPLPTPYKAQSSSLTHKFAAHFNARSPKSDTKPATPAVAPQTTGLNPTTARTSSFESGSSTGTNTRSTTPRPAERPTITVSFSPDDYAEYHDLFVRPPELDTRRSETPASVRRSNTRSGTDAVAPSRAPPAGKSSPEQVIYRRGQTPASAIAAAMRHRQTPSNGSGPPTPPEKAPKVSSESKNQERNDGSSIQRLPSGTQEPPRSPSSELEKGIPPSLQRRPSVAVSSISSVEDAPPSTRSRMRPPSSPSRSRPPSIPLPLPPTPTSPSFPTHAKGPPPTGRTSKDESVSSLVSSREGAARPRALTMSSGYSSSASISRARSSAARKLPLVPPIVESVVERGVLNVESASREELREALKERNQEYKDLADFVLKMMESQISQVANLEEKLSQCEAECLKQEKTIQGLIHIINDHNSQQTQPKPLPPSILNKSRFAASTASAADSDLETHKTGQGLLPSRLNYHSDSGGESHATSGHESLRASGGSGSESVTSTMFHRNKKARRSLGPGESPYLTRSGTLLRTSQLPPPSGPPDKGLPDLPYNAKSASVSSTSVSPSSSTSSLLPPSPSITMSSLSAIPEGVTSSLRPPRQGQFESPDDRRNRFSISSMTSSSTAASSTISIKPKRSRPPSIAQVLDSPNASISPTRHL